MVEVVRAYGSRGAPGIGGGPFVFGSTGAGFGGAPGAFGGGLFAILI